MGSIYQNIKNEKQWKASVGMSQSEFDKLYSIFEKRYFPKKGNPYLKVPQPILTDKKEALFFVLHYLKAYPTLVNMSLYFNISEASVSNYLEKIMPALKSSLLVLNTEVRRSFFSEDDFIKWFSEVEDIFIDGFEVPVQRPKKESIQKKV